MKLDYILMTWLIEEIRLEFIEDIEGIEGIEGGAEVVHIYFDSAGIKKMFIRRWIHE
jgi:hypothetical protein